MPPKLSDHAAQALRIPQTFDLRPGPPISPLGGQLLDYPDELMIDWGDTPVNSTASIYWPQVQALDVVRLAGRMYATNQLSISDPHTLQCTVTGGLTYVPIPPGEGENFAGLFTIDLPPTVRTGREYNVIVRRISSRQVSIGNVVAGVSKRAVGKQGRTTQRNWRYIVGTFQIKIPVANNKVLLLPEENTYSILRWRFGQLSPSSRWHPVIQRYLWYLAGRVNALGGNAGSIKPSPSGVVPPGSGKHGGSGPPGHHGEEFTGKVSGVVYDRFGDFEGFLLVTESGHEHAFQAREARIEALVRFAWMDRVVISVFAGEGHPERPVSIVLRQAPRWHEH